MKEALTRLYRECSHGAEFAARLSERGWKLVKGRRTDLCVLDDAGHLHSLARRIDGVTAEALRAFMGDFLAV
jgi:hypothetical protein